MMDLERSMAGDSVPDLRRKTDSLEIRASELLPGSADRTMDSRQIKVSELTTDSEPTMDQAEVLTTGPDSELRKKIPHL